MIGNSIAQQKLNIIVTLLKILIFIVESITYYNSNYSSWGERIRVLSFSRTSNIWLTYFNYNVLLTLERFWWPFKQNNSQKWSLSYLSHHFRSSGLSQTPWNMGLAGSAEGKQDREAGCQVEGAPNTEQTPVTCFLLCLGCSLALGARGVT